CRRGASRDCRGGRRASRRILAAMTASDDAPIAPEPRANPELLGHEAAETGLRRLAESGRMPHAILLSGPRGIGKATLAFRLARLVLGQPSKRAGGEGLAIDPESGVFHRV